MGLVSKCVKVANASYTLGNHCSARGAKSTMKNSLKTPGAVLPATSSPYMEKENQSTPTLSSPPCNPNNLRSAFTKSARKEDNRFSTIELSKSLDINADVGVGKRSLKNGDDLNAEEENELEAFLRLKKATNSERKETMDKLVQIESSMKLVRDDQKVSLRNQANMMGRLATIEDLMKSANPRELEKLKKERDHIQRQNVLVTKQREGENRGVGETKQRGPGCFRQIESWNEYAESTPEHCRFQFDPLVSSTDSGLYYQARWEGAYHAELLAVGQ